MQLLTGVHHRWTEFGDVVGHSISDATALDDQLFIEDNNTKLGPSRDPKIHTTIQNLSL